MNKIYSSLNQHSFKKAAIIALIAGDIGILTYLYLKFSDRDLFQKSLDLVLQAMPIDQGGNFHPEMQSQLYSLMINALITMLILVFLYHLFVNFLWHKGKFIARGYLQVYAWTAGPLLAISGLFSLFSNPLLSLFFFLMSTLFLFVALGMKYFPEKNPKSSKLLKK